MKQILAYGFLLAVGCGYAQVQRPADFLGYELGEKFTRHHQVVDYYEHVDRNSPNVKLVEYGKTYEDRPLLLAFISSEENINQLEDIRKDNLRRTQLESGSISTDVGVVWLSYNVHGNESVSTEASMETLYNLLTEKQDWLDDLVVIIDPCLNPDGRERYVNFYWQYGNQPYNPDPNSLEHLEPWPRGRANHYLYDLNRDWAWQTQIESKQRIVYYNQWMPQIHVDFHEQGVNSPYYFAPAAEPYHELITDWQRQFQVDIGKNHAKYFDENNWFYFTKQYFDLLYPSYGDTYPTFNGAIGMTYEQGGSGRAGLGVHTQEMDTLTLADRIAHHHTTGISTVEEAYKQKTRMLQEFSDYFDRSVNQPTGKYKTYVVKNTDEEKIRHLKKWLDMNQIQYGSASGRGLRGFNYFSKREESFSINSNDLVVSTTQPKSVLANVLFEPDTYLSDSLTYDITTWAIPYAYGLNAYATTTSVNVGQSNSSTKEEAAAPELVYAYAFEWKNMADATFLAALMKKNYKVRFSSSPFSSSGKSFGRGAVIVAKRDNRSVKDFEREVWNLARSMEQELVPLATGFSDSGPDIGSDDVYYLKPSRIALVSGEGTSSLSFGSAWYFFEQELQYPVSVLNTSYLSRVDLSEYQILVFPDGRYSSLEESHQKKIEDWVQKGGNLILIQGAINKYVDTDFSALKRFGDEKEKEQLEGKEKKIEEQRRLVKYGDQERDGIQDYVPGAIFRVTMDNTHPMAYGYDGNYFSLKTANHRFGLLKEGWNVGYIRSKEDHMSGFAGANVRTFAENSLIFGVEERGGGSIIYFTDNPLFRSFWYNGKLLLANALFFVN